MEAKLKMRSKGNKSITIVKEGLLALAIFVLPFLVYIHVFFKDVDIQSFVDSRSFIDFWKNDFYSFLYTFLYNITQISLLLIWLNTTIEPIKHFLWLPLSFFLCSFFVAVYPQSFSLLDYHWVLLTGISLVVILRTIVNEGLNRSWKVRYVTIVLGILMPLILMTWSRFYPYGHEDVIILGFNLGDFGFDDASKGLFQLMKKIMIVSYLLVWYFSENRWWKYALLSPIILTANQLFNLVGDHSVPMDEIELTQSGPFLLGLAVFLVLLAQAVERQRRLQVLLSNWYGLVEAKLKKRFQRHEMLVNTTKKQLENKKTTTDDLRKIQGLLESKLKK